MPHLNDHVQFVMPPIGSVGSGLASYRDMTNALKDEKGTIYSPICNIVYMLTEVVRNNYDKVTLSSSKMLCFYYKFFRFSLSVFAWNPQTMSVFYCHSLKSTYSRSLKQETVVKVSDLVKLIPKNSPKYGYRSVAVAYLHTILSG
jgi:hypothetical protein